MQNLMKIALCGLLVSPLVFAKPVVVENHEQPRLRSPGKPLHPLDVEVLIDRSTLRAGVESDGGLVVRSRLPVRDVQIVLQPSAGMNVLSRGLLEHRVNRLSVGEPLRMPLTVVPGADDARGLSVVVRAVQEDGRVISRAVNVNLGAEPKRRDKRDLKSAAARAETGERRDVVVPAQQAIERGH